MMDNDYKGETNVFGLKYQNSFETRQPETSVNAGLKYDLEEILR